MKIISKFQDYYDSVMGYGFDPNCIYKRMKTLYDHKSDEFAKLNSVKVIQDYFDDHTIDITRGYYNDFDRQGDGVKLTSQKLIIFCGKLYPLLISNVDMTNPGSYQSWNNKHYYTCYSAEHVDALVSKYGDKKKKQKYFNPKPPTKRERRYSWRVTKRLNQPKVAQFFDAYPAERNEELVNLHFEVGSPIILINGLSEHCDNGNVVLNPILKDYQFFKIVDSFTAFQDLSMFVSGVMGGQCPPMVEIEDKYRIAMHGYDEQSFRKRPTKKKVNRG